jgi:hypothetical protein
MSLSEIKIFNFGLGFGAYKFELGRKLGGSEVFFTYIIALRINVCMYVEAIQQYVHTCRM